jgi:type VI secretion system protein VasD
MHNTVPLQLSWPRAGRVLATACLLGAATVSCGKTPPPQIPMPAVTVIAPSVVKTKATITIQATPGVNPNEDGRPSPIVVRLYQLQADEGFKGADFAKLNASDQATLGPDLIRRDEYTLTPGALRQVEVELPEQARALCAMAAFQRLDTVWRACANLPATLVAITIEDTRITVTIPGQ